MQVQFSCGAANIMHTSPLEVSIPQVGAEVLLKDRRFKVVRVVHEYEKIHPFNTHKNAFVEGIEVRVYMEEISQ